MGEVLNWPRTFLEEYVYAPPVMPIPAKSRMRVGRIVCALAGGLIIGFGVLYRLSDPASFDPFVGRLLVGVASLGLAGASYASRWVRTHFGLLIQGLMYVILVWFAVLTALNGFSANYALGLFFATAVMGGTLVMVLNRLAPLVVFSLFEVLLVATLLWHAPDAQVGKTILMACFSSGAVVLCGGLGLRIQLQRVLAESEARTQVVLTQTTEGVFLVDACTLGFLEVNPAYCQLLGYAAGQLQERTLWEVEEEGGLGMHLAHFRRHGHFAGEARHRRSDGTLVEVELSADLIHYDGGKVICVVVRDIQARKQTERALRQAKERAEEALRAKTILLDNMSHELRTPLTSVLGYASVLAEEVENEAHQTFACAIERGGRRLQSTLDTVLELARLEGGEVACEEEAFDLSAVMRAVAEDYRGQAEQKGLSINVEAPPRATRGHADPCLLQKAVGLLVENAVKFTEAGRVTIRVSESADGVQVRVCDTGPGIDAEAVSHVFGAFRQGSEGLTRSHGGVGLGLTVAQRRIHLMGGTLEVERTGPEGTTFCVHLPACARPAGSREAAGGGEKGA